MNLLEARTLPTALGRKLYTAEDLECLPSDARYELIRGELCLMPNNSAEHGFKTATLTIHAGYFIEENELGTCFAAETRFTIEGNPDTTMGPDFAYIAKARLTSIPPKGYLRLAPDLVVETRSPGDKRTAFALKISQWLHGGVKVVWAVEPATQTLTIHRTGELPQTLTIEDTLTEETLLPGFSLAMRRLFRPI